MKVADLLVMIVLVLLVCVPVDVFAEKSQSHKIHVGVRPGMWGADGEPANDIPMIGILGRYRLSEKWLVGVGADYAEFDYEEPAKIVGLKASEVIDATPTELIFSAWAEREFGDATSRLTPFVFAGLGIGIVDEEDVSGFLEDGTEYYITTKADTEIIPGVGVGLRYDVLEHFMLECAGRLDYHFTQWESIDHISGNKGTIDDYLTWGGYIGFIVGF